MWWCKAPQNRRVVDLSLRNCVSSGTCCECSDRVPSAVVGYKPPACQRLVESTATTLYIATNPAHTDIHSSIPSAELAATNLSLKATTEIPQNKTKKQKNTTFAQAENICSCTGILRKEWRENAQQERKCSDLRGKKERTNQPTRERQTQLPRLDRCFPSCRDLLKFLLLPYQNSKMNRSS